VNDTNKHNLIPFALIDSQLSPPQEYTPSAFLSSALQDQEDDDDLLDGFAHNIISNSPLANPKGIFMIMPYLLIIHH